MYGAVVRRRIVIGALAGLAVVALLGAELTARDTTPSGLLLDGEVVVPTEDVATLARHHGERWAEVEVLIVAGPLTEMRTRAELGLALDVDALERSLRTLRDARGIRAIELAWRARFARLDLQSQPVIDRERLRDALQSLGAAVYRAPVAATLYPSGRMRSAGEAGRELAIPASLDAIATSLLDGERRITLETRELLPEALPWLDTIPLAVIGSYHTHYRARGDEGPRASNVRLAAELLDGAVIAPGGRLSFNDRVGPRTLGRGFRVAHVIERGELVDGIGGGVCQVASTLHAAAFMAGLPIIEARPHTRPLPYIPMGLDATVAYPELDLVIASSLDVPITIRAHASSGDLDVELFARAAPSEVRWERDILERTPYDERIEIDASLPIDGEVVAEAGGPGFSLLRTRIIRDARGERTERVNVRYPPTTRIVRRGS